MGSFINGIKKSNIFCRKTLRNKIICEKKDKKFILITDGIVSSLNLSEFYFLLEFSKNMDHHLFSMMLTSLSHDKAFQKRKDDKYQA